MIKTPAQLAVMREAGRLLAQVFDMLDGFVAAGRSTLELDSTVDNMKEQAIADGVYHGAVDKEIADKVKPSLITDRGYMVAMVTTMARRESTSAVANAAASPTELPISPAKMTLATMVA